MYCNNNKYVISSHGRHWLYLLALCNNFPWQIIRDNLACNGHENIRDRGDTVTVYPTEFHVRMSRLFAENVAAWKTQFPLSLITFWPSPYAERRWPRRIVGADRGKSLLNNRAETLQLPRGSRGAGWLHLVFNDISTNYMPRVFVCLFVCLLNTRLLIQ